MSTTEKKRSTILLLLVAAMAYYFMIPERNWFGQSYLETTQKNGFAVVELFTSEGCSSCPEADDLIADIQKKAVGKDIYILAFHVDYWNRLGWKDRFSSPDFTERQQYYANLRQSSLLYTPQFIVNGNKEMPGNESRRLYSAISSGLEEPAAVTITAKVFAKEDNFLLQYEATSVPKGTSLIAALVQKKDSTAVKQGENRGHFLKHVQIVSQLERIAFEKRKGEMRIYKPAEFNTKDWEVVIFLQQEHTGAILAATRCLLDKDTF